jgi:pimeloyl-ACP methyl ester carboxylesterase
MAYTDNDGVRIYYEVVGKGQPLLMYHPFGYDHTYWSNPDENWVQGLQNDCSLILMDARGHGASDKPHDPKEYQLSKQVSDVIAVLDALSIEKTHFMGYSMGGKVGFGLACHAPQRFFSLVLGGAGAADDLTERPNPLIPIYRQGPQAVIRMTEEMSSRPVPSSTREILLSNDYEALAAMLEWKERDGMESLLPSVSVPALIYAGDKDGSYADAKRASELMPNATFLTLRGDHLTLDYASLLPQVKRFVHRWRLRSCQIRHPPNESNGSCSN